MNIVETSGYAKWKGPQEQGRRKVAELLDGASTAHDAHARLRRAQTENCEGQTLHLLALDNNNRVVLGFHGNTVILLGGLTEDKSHDHTKHVTGSNHQALVSMAAGLAKYKKDHAIEHEVITPSEGSTADSKGAALAARFAARDPDGRKR